MCETIVSIYIYRILEKSHHGNTCINDSYHRLERSDRCLAFETLITPGIRIVHIIANERVSTAKMKKLYLRLSKVPSLPLDTLEIIPPF